MAKRGLKMFNHLVDPEMNFKIKTFIRECPLESFIIVSFLYMLVRWFCYRALLHCYLGLITFSFGLQYGDYFASKIFVMVFNEMKQILERQHQGVVMAPFTNTPDINDGKSEDDSEDDKNEEVDDENKIVTEEIVDDSYLELRQRHVPRG